MLTLVPALGLLVNPFALQDDFADAWQKVDSNIRRSYYARQSRREEMEARLDRYRPIASAAKSREEFRDAVNKMIAEFKDSHFELFTPADQGYYAMSDLLQAKDAPKMAGIGAWFKKTDSGYVVQMVLEGTPAQRAGLRKGDLMLKAGDVSFAPVEAIEKSGKSAELTYRRGVETRKVQVEIESKPAMQMFLDATKASARVIEASGKKIGYIHLWTMASENFKKAMDAAVFGLLKDTDSLILDLRDGFGGRPEGYTDAFFRPEMKIEWKVGEGSGITQLYGYGRPMAVLINNGTRSAKEVVSYAFKKSKRAILIGTNTAGHVLGTVPRRANDWAILEIPMVEVITDGRRLEGVGVAPDILVEDGFDANGNDAVIQRALSELSSSKGN